MGLARWTIAVLLALACCVGPDVRAAEAAPPAPAWPMWELGESSTGLAQYAVFDRPGNAGPADVGKKLPNLFGLYDMYGNAAEWCYVSNRLYRDAETVIVAPVELRADGTLRGGWFASGPDEARSGYRGSFYEYGRYAWNWRGDAGAGFRVVVELPPEAQPPARDTEGTK